MYEHSDARSDTNYNYHSVKICIDLEFIDECERRLKRGSVDGCSGLDKLIEKFF